MKNGEVAIIYNESRNSGLRSSSQCRCSHALQPRPPHHHLRAKPQSLPNGFPNHEESDLPSHLQRQASKVLDRVGVLPYFQNMKHCNHFLSIKLPGGDIMIEGEPLGYQGSWNGIMKAMYDSLKDLCP